MPKSQKPKLLLHVCCAICGAYITEILKNDYLPVLFYDNSNIHPKEEYEKRKQSVQKLAEIYSLEFIESAYGPEKWHEKIKGLENEPEGGSRCPICFEMRLKKTAEVAKGKNIEYFTTTLAVSPYKNETAINRLGEKVANELKLKFIKSTDFSQTKKEIWQKTRELARKYEFYHQKYCGCIYSQRMIKK